MANNVFGKAEITYNYGYQSVSLRFEYTKLKICMVSQTYCKPWIINKKHIFHYLIAKFIKDINYIYTYNLTMLSFRITLFNIKKLTHILKLILKRKEY